MEKLVNQSGIYCIENKINGKKYVGQAGCLSRRWREHKSKLTNGKKETPILKEAWAKYGVDNFIFYVLIYCEQDQLNDLEIFYIKKMGSHFSSWGYNVSWGGDTPSRGIKLSEERKRQISEGQRGDKNPRYGKHLTDQQKINVSNGIKENMTDEKRQKISAWQLGRKNKRLAGSKSNYVGISYKTTKNYWESSFRYNMKRFFIGRSEFESECAAMYNEVMLENYGYKCYDILNIVPQSEIDDLWNSPLTPEQIEFQSQNEKYLESHPDTYFFK